ncbi:MAG: hypothetical protein NXI27_00210 [Alphaproteobacteria bacterium]|nr:hypothetical protein [Alphaproteobacteria bacterium]
MNIDLLANTASGGHADGETLSGIESLIGSKLFGDILAGDSQDNFIWGSGGNDTISGNGGNDFLEGGLGADTIDGGPGSEDTISYRESIAGVTVNLATNTASGGHATGDTFSGIEHIDGSFRFGDVMTGDTQDNTIFGYGGDDVIDGGGGRDYLNGGRGDDVLNGGSGLDTIEGGEGADTLDGGDSSWDVVSYSGSNAGVIVDLSTNTVSGGHATGDTIANFRSVIGSNFYSDTLTGNHQSNWLWGNGGDDILLGGGGRDGLEGGAGADYLDGGAGDKDIAIYHDSDAGVTVNLLTNFANGGHATGDTILDLESIKGSYGYGDFLTGDAWRNILVGYGGNDTLVGGAGNDQLEGGSDDDHLTGGTGDDTFAYAADFGNDIITDFTAGAASEDVIEFNAVGGLASYADVLSKVADDGTDTTLTLDIDNSIVLKNVLVSELSTDDFRFA